MEIAIRSRLGIGLDIEHNEEICYRVHYEDGTEGLVAYQGIIISIPFFTIYIGNFIPMEEIEASENGTE